MSLKGSGKWDNLRQLKKILKNIVKKPLKLIKKIQNCFIFQGLIYEIKFNCPKIKGILSKDVTVIYYVLNNNFSYAKLDFFLFLRKIVLRSFSFFCLLSFYS